MEIRERIDELNKTKNIIRWANILLIWCCLEIIVALIAVKLAPASFTLTISADALMELYTPQLNGGLIVAAGFFPALVLKIFQQNFWVALVGTLTLLVHYFFVLF